MDIKKFLESEYSYENFLEFISDKFSGFEENNIDYEEPDTNIEQKHILKYKFMGSCQLDDKKEIGFFEVITTEKTDIENNRVSLGNILKNKASNELLDSAIAVFYNPNNPSVWRLSFIKFSYDENDKQQVSNLKRFTYVLGKNIPIKTAYNQLKNLESPSLIELEEAFSVDKVTKEFFINYKDLYFKLVKDLTVVNQKNITQQEEKILEDNKQVSFYIKKLLGRIVFLYFVQKKGWLNSDRKFLSNLFYNFTKENPNINFYDEILEDLFFNALNTKRDNDKINLGGNEYEIPYLNGGLFEEDEYDKTDLTITNENLKQVLELFDSYNFTVIEDTPHDSEIAIDPEMLGRVFEDLLEDRKEKGAFYTPREIVHYMCQQSIINYLLNFYGEDNLEDIKSLVIEDKTDTKFIRNNAKDIKKYLEDIKVLDPAIGSGAFPMGMLHEIVAVLSNLDKTADIGQLKRKVIENSIYGIDIEHSAVEIAKLRFWLSIVVDEEKPTPLPNLSYKIMVGNSLIETINGFDPLEISKNNKGNGERIKRMKDKFHSYFNSSSNEEKNIIKKDIEKDVDDIFIVALRNYQNKLEEIISKNDLLNTNASLRKKHNEQLQNVSLIKKIQKEYEENRFTTELFLYKIYFAEVLENGGFDIVIGNPPYIKEFTNKSAFNGTRDLECYQGKMDIWYLFGCKGIELLKENGILSFIATNNWISNFGASKFRNKILTRTRIIEFIDFGDYKVFETAGIQTMILIAKQVKNSSKYYCNYSKIINKNIEKKDLNSFLYKKEDKRFSIFESSVNPKELIDENITFLESRIFKILDKIEVNKNFELDKNKEITNGIQVQQETVNKSSLKILGNDYKLNEGIFNLTTKEKDDLNFDMHELELVKPLFTSSEIEKYFTNKTNKNWVIYTDSSFKDKSKIEKFPKLKNHIDRFIDVITTDNKPYGIHRARKEYFFKGEKILVLRKCVGKPIFGYADFDTYVNQAFYVIKSERINLKYLTALLNSKLVSFWLKYKGKMQGDNYQVDKEPILNIPIKNIEDTKPFKILVDYIIYLKQEKKENYIIEFFERVIDIAVYELYFKEELHLKGFGILEVLESELIPFDNSFETIERVYKKLSDKNHKVAYNVNFIDTLDIVKTIENK
ncbi:Eco57I restriction-modification methylase domain-containing protein [Aliarcobacter cryaerophilus]|uniref:Eco57I restriction-modification methylase domain-containing protein n=1 Tax=Aliarcobacter cryaerophilus TaxID=28198 RepID=UPI0021B5B072|nr:Eco57I restriction-modification methylase domain-containing protein [Aliarcobacter cryaerophilus]MCT7493061.1 Eco57I restriction-modification methylase domain-containing protein [Aliarcobacter cryaerophilus]